jgi:nitroreductase
MLRSINKSASKHIIRGGYYMNYNEFKELVEKRYSVRKFEDKKVEKEKILEVLDAARFAPSAHNNQPWHFVVITEKEMLEKMQTVYETQWFKGAPAVIVALADHKKSWVRDDGKDHSDIDLGITVDHLTLAATANGLGTCWVCAFNAKKCTEVLELPENIEPVALIPIGYPKYPTAKNKIREDLETMVSWEEYKK